MPCRSDPGAPPRPVEQCSAASLLSSRACDRKEKSESSRPSLPWGWSNTIFGGIRRPAAGGGGTTGASGCAPCGIVSQWLPDAGSPLRRQRQGLADIHQSNPANTRHPNRESMRILRGQEAAAVPGVQQAVAPNDLAHPNPLAVRQFVPCPQDCCCCVLRRMQPRWRECNPDGPDGSDIVAIVAAYRRTGASAPPCPTRTSR